MRLEGPLATWTADDYIREGRYCPWVAIQSNVDDLAIQLGAEACALLAHNGRSIIQSLAFVSGETEAANNLRESLRLSPIHQAQDHVIPFVDGLETPDLLVESLARLQPLAPLIETGGRGWDVVALFPATARSLGMVLLALAPEGRVESSRLESLLTMLNGTTIASLARDGQVTRKLRGIPDRQESSLVSTDDRAGVSALLDVVREELDASGVALYTYDRSLRALKRAAESSLSTITAPVQFAPDVDGANLIPVAFTKRKVVICTPENATLPSSTGAIRLLPCWEPHDTEVETDQIAVPVPSAPFGASFVPLGVLCVAWERDTWEHAITQYDLALIRNAALRVALHRARSAEAETLASLLSWRRSRDVTKRFRLESRTPSERDGVPIEFQRIIPAMASLMAEVAQSTQADTASLRVVVPGGSAIPRENGYELLRIVAHPLSRMDESNQRVSVESDSIVALAARLGEPVIVDDLTDNDELRALGVRAPIRTDERTMSELAFPIRLQDRLVAVLNLESTTSGIFRMQRERGEAWAEEIALLISDQRSAAVQSALDMTSHVHRNGHRVLRAAAEVRRVTVGVEAAEHIGESLDELLKELGSDFEYQSSRGHITVEALINQQIAELDEPAFVLAVEGSVRLAVAGEIEMVLGNALIDVLSNVQAHMRRGVGDRVTIEVKESILAGTVLADILIREPTKFPCAPSMTESLFREPVTVDEEFARPHLGSFAAATLLRSVGGDAYFEVIDDAQIAIRVSVPARRI